MKTFEDGEFKGEEIESHDLRVIRVYPDGLETFIGNYEDYFEARESIKDGEAVGHVFKIIENLDGQDIKVYHTGVLA